MSLDARRRNPEVVSESAIHEQLPWIRYRLRSLFPHWLGLDDLEQSVLLAVLRSLPSYRGEGPLIAWVDAITVRVGMKHARRVRALARRELDLCEDVAPLTVTAPFEDYLARKRVQGLLGALSPEQANAVFLHHVVGLGVAEVAAQQGVPTETARSRLRLGMRELRRRARVSLPSNHAARAAPSRALSA